MRLAILSALLFVGQVFAADCSCTGKSDEEVHGGNRDPLRWQSIVRLMDSGSAFNPPWNCFEHRVFNDSENEVTDIFWKVAKFEEDSIPKKDNRCQVYIGEGSIQKPLAEGLLYYSVGKVLRYARLCGPAPRRGCESGNTDPSQHSGAEFGDRGFQSLDWCEKQHSFSIVGSTFK